MVAKKIGTHNGKFHADEALACYLLTQLPEYEDAEIVRTRDSTVLADLDVVVDVGGVYDPSTHRYDHHQREFQETFDKTKYTSIRLSSAGLVYRHFGKRVLSCKFPSLSEHELEALYDKCYRDFIMPLDAIDNGIEAYPESLFPNGERPNPLYSDGTGLASRINHLNPGWNEEITPAQSDAAFAKAMALAGRDFTQITEGWVKYWLTARGLVSAAFGKRHELEASAGESLFGQVLILDQSMPWKSHLFDLEQEEQQAHQVKKLKTEGSTTSSLNLLQYVLYPDGASSGWRIQSVPVSENSFKNRAPLPEPWRGLRDDELSRVSGVEGCVFVHASGFIGGNKTREGALKMAYQALKFLKKL